jgi:hypothetical protein
MTASTQGLTAQGQAGSGILPQQGIFTPGFPPPFGAEQYQGTAQQYGLPTPGWPQGPYGMQAPYGQFPWSLSQSQFGGQAQQGFGQQAPGQVPQQVQQVFGQLIGQILPIAEQMILPQVIALAVQQVQQHVQQLVTQLALPQLTGQQPWMTPGLAGQFTRPYPVFS